MPQAAKAYTAFQQANKAARSELSALHKVVRDATVNLRKNTTPSKSARTSKSAEKS